MFYDIFDSPIGSLTVSTDGKHITGLHIEGDRYFTAVPADWVRDAAQPLLQDAQRQLADYFAGGRSEFRFPLHFTGTVFQQEVWRHLQSLKAGETTTYKAVAEAIGRPRAVRAVGSAIGRNPICVIVPCHRVLAENGGMGGYVAGIERKQRLLELEAQA